MSDRYNEAIEVVLNSGIASTSKIHRSLRIGYNEAAALMVRMEEDGYVTKPNYIGKREILITEPQKDTPND